MAGVLLTQSTAAATATVSATASADQPAGTEEGRPHLPSTAVAPLSPLRVQPEYSATDAPASGTPELAPGARASRTAATREPVRLPPSQTIADQRLQRIYDSQLQFFAELAANPNMATAVRDQRVQNLLNRYQSLLLDNPEYIYGYILYGKLLRQVDQRDLANMAFLKANGLNPNIAVVKQQIANYLSEEGDYDLALPYYLAAIQLEPQVALYHYQLGELLHTYRASFTGQSQLDATTLELQMQDAFAKASELEPQTRLYLQRYAESFFDVGNPDWERALTQWEALENNAENALQRQIASLQKVRVLIALERFTQAQATLDRTDEPSLSAAKAVLQAQLNAAAKTTADSPPANAGLQ